MWTSDLTVISHFRKISTGTYYAWDDKVFQVTNFHIISMDSDAILTFPFRKASWIKRVAETHGIFNMAEDTLRRSCENGENSYLFDLAGNNVKWKTISLTHVEYPEGNPGSVITILGF